MEMPLNVTLFVAHNNNNTTEKKREAENENDGRNIPEIRLQFFGPPSGLLSYQNKQQIDLHRAISIDQ